MFDYLFRLLRLTKKMTMVSRDGQKHEVNWSTPWPRLNFIELIKRDSSLDITQYTQTRDLLKDIKAKKISFDGMEKMGLAGLVDNLYKKVCRPRIINPTIIYQYPKYLQPLARTSDRNADTVDQFQLVVNGWEIVKAYSELVDPIDQKQRFAEQRKAKKSGFNEVMEGDNDFILALEYGAPPISGWGLGIDRLVALLTGQDNLRDVVLFPLLRPGK
jgi:lysyl-tRNA synthetase class 2